MAKFPVDLGASIKIDSHFVNNATGKSYTMTVSACRVGRGTASFIGLVSVLLGFSSLHAQPLGFEDITQDLDQTMECRRLLLEDPILGRLNLGVRVKNRVAVLWGPAPSREISRRAEQCLRTMIELADVKNEMHLAPDADWGSPNGNLKMPQVLPDRLPPVLPRPARPPFVPDINNPHAADVARGH